MIAIRSLVKKYRDFTAVHGLDIEIPAGELYVVLGPNGAGKTTAMKCVVGLLHPTAGRIEVGGFDVTREPQRAKALIGYIPDRPFLYEKLTGAELVRFTGQLYGADPERLIRNAEALLERFELRGWEDQLVESYSYGMRQKIVLTSVLAREPRVLVIDEPIVGLDPRAAKALRDLLRERTRDGCATLLSTHSVGFAEQIADRIGIIAHGRLLEEGTMAELEASAGEAVDLEEVFLTLTREERDQALANELGRGGDA